MSNGNRGLSPMLLRSVPIYIALEYGRRLLGMGEQPFSGHHADQNIPVLVETDDRGREVMAQCVRYDDGLLILPYGYQAIRGTQIDSDDHSSILNHVAVNSPCVPTR